MKLNFKSVFYIALSASIVLASCKKNENVIEDTVGNSTGNGGGNQAKVNTTLAGIIVDESGSPISGAQVSVGTTVQFTDNNGSFIFDNINTNKERTFVKVSKPGFFDGSRVVKPFENQLTRISVMLQSNAYDGVISGTIGGSVSLTNGAKVELPANGVVVEATGIAYTGNVNVSMAYLDAWSNKIGALAPGDMKAIDANGDSRLLTSYGMLNVELTGDAGEKLQVANGSQATITIPTTIFSAPSTIPLWYFDVVDGIWKEEGNATLQGNNYVGTVNHFTTWNVDFPERPVPVSGTLLDCNGNPLVGVWIEIRRQNNGAYIGSTYTDSAGFYQGDVPFGVGLTMNILGSFYCSNNSTLLSINLGPYSSSQVIPTISVCNYNETLIQGTINNSCGASYALIKIYEQGTNNLISTPNYFTGSFTSILCGVYNSGIYIVGETISGDKDTIVLNTLNASALNNAGVLNFCDTSVLMPGRMIIGWSEFYTNNSIHDVYYKTGQTNGSLDSNAVIKAVRTSYGYAVMENMDTVLKICKQYGSAGVHPTAGVYYKAAMSYNSVSSFYDTTTYGRFIVLKNNSPYLYLNNSATVSTAPGIIIYDYGTRLEINSWVCSTNGLSFGLNLDCNEYSFFNSLTSMTLNSVDDGTTNPDPHKGITIFIEAYF